MQLRLIVANFLFISAIPFVLFGLIDPLEGGISLLVAFGIYIAAFIISQQKPKKYLWIPFVIAVVVGGAALGYAIAELSTSAEPRGVDVPVLFGLWGYRAAVLALLVGGLITAYRQFFPRKSA